MSGCDKTDNNVPEEVTLRKYFKLKKLLEIFHDIQSAKDKMFKAIRAQKRCEGKYYVKNL